MTPSDKAAREFWIYADYEDSESSFVDEYGYSCFTEKQEDATWEIKIHVIEYSAYESLKSELDALRAAADNKDHTWHCKDPICHDLNDAYKKLESENARLKAILEEIKYVNKLDGIKERY